MRSLDIAQFIFGVAFHWITNDWVQQDVLLDAVEIEGDHSGMNIGDHLIEIISNYDIRDKILSITADNASSNKSMATYLNTFMPQLLCLSTYWVVLGMSSF